MLVVPYMASIKWGLFAIGEVKGTNIHLEYYSPAFGTTAKFLGPSLESTTLKLSCKIRFVLIQKSSREFSISALKR